MDRGSPDQALVEPRLRCRLTVAVALMVLAACSDFDGGVHEITETRVTEAPRYPPVEASSRKRFGYRERAAGLAWDVPPGWEQLPSTQSRLGNFAVPGRDELECYLSVLPPRGDDVVPANVNRWRRQMSLPPATPEEVRDLPRRTVLDVPATFVELSGTYAGMRGDQNHADYKLAGAILTIRGSAVFVKMLGPAEHVDAELDNLELFLSSLRIGTTSAGSSTPPDAGSRPPGTGFDPSAIEWDAPATWHRGPASRMRVVTFSPDGHDDVECYVTVLGGAAGGLERNVNRWRDQMGQSPLGPADLAALPRLDVLKRPSPMVEIEGSYTGMDGTSHAEAVMLGVVCDLGSHTLFVKMTGPAEKVRAERGRFTAFCESLR